MSHTCSGAARAPYAGVLALRERLSEVSPADGNISDSGSSSSRSLPPSCWRRRPSETVCWKEESAAPGVRCAGELRASLLGARPARAAARRRARRRATWSTRLLRVKKSPGLIRCGATRRGAGGRALELEPFLSYACRAGERAAGARSVWYRGGAGRQRLFEPTSAGLRASPGRPRRRAFCGRRVTAGKDRYDRAVGALREAELAGGRSPRPEKAPPPEPLRK